MPEDTPSLDLSKIDELDALNGEDDEDDVVIELIEIVLNNTPERLNTLSSQFDSSHFSELGKTAHLMKSGLGSVGAVKAFGICQKLESLCESGDGTQSGPWIARLKEEYEIVSNLLNEVVQERKNKQER